MPSTGTPSANTASGAFGGWTSVTDSGPPERMTPRGAKARTSASLTSQGWISQYTPSSRTRRAMSCVYWAPKSRISMRCAWMSGCAAVPGCGLPAGPGTLASGGNTYEHRARAHLADVAAAGITHCRPQSAGELVQDRDDAALVGHATL